MINERNKNVSVVIPNYNGDRFIGMCLERVLSSDPAQVVVVNDASTDNSADEIRRFPRVTLIENPKNFGPTKSRNIGARAASARQLFFMDGDILLQGDYIGSLSVFLDNNPDAGVVSGKIIESATGERMMSNFGHDPAVGRTGIGSLINSAVSRVEENSLAAKVLRSAAEQFTLNYVADTKRKVDWVVERAFMVSSETYWSVGGMDERFFMFAEGPDLCRRIRQTGRSVWYTPEAEGIHLDINTHTPAKRNAFMLDSIILYHQIHSSRLESVIAGILYNMKYKNRFTQG